MSQSWFRLQPIPARALTDFRALPAPLAVRGQVWHALGGRAGLWWPCWRWCGLLSRPLAVQAVCALQVARARSLSAATALGRAEAACAARRAAEDGAARVRSGARYIWEIQRTP